MKENKLVLAKKIPGKIAILVLIIFALKKKKHFYFVIFTLHHIAFSHNNNYLYVLKCFAVFLKANKINI